MRDAAMPNPDPIIPRIAVNVVLDLNCVSRRNTKAPPQCKDAFLPAYEFPL